MNPAKQATSIPWWEDATVCYNKGAIVVGDSPLPPLVCVTLLGLA
jgi:hypothetical protein